MKYVNVIIFIFLFKNHLRGQPQYQVGFLQKASWHLLVSD